MQNKRKQSKRLTIHDKNSIREYFKPNMPIKPAQVQRWTAEKFGHAVHITTIRRILKDERTLESYNIKKESAKARFNFQRPRHPELDTEVAAWVRMANTKNACVTGGLIARAGIKIASRLNLNGRVSCSKGWLHRLQIRHNLKMYRLHGEAASANLMAVQNGRDTIQQVTRLFRTMDIYNMDETGVFYNGQPCTTISDQARPGQKKDKSRISVALAANADGSDKLPPMFIGKSKKPRCFGGLSSRELGLLYHSNRKAWMTMALFSEWISNFNSRMASEGRHVLLILDNASSHDPLDVILTNVRMLMLPPNTTAFLQPMDAGIIAAFKSHYKRRQMDHVVDMIDDPTVESGREPRNLYAVDVLTAMRWSVSAWNCVTSTTIRNCWAHTGVLPRNLGHSLQLLLN
ncbi:hypothetical protein DYB34_004871 [Aphanomyces astaci]|uniref:HTH CENPB-type domain-containing protein n=1 Tax=Aphanomyces astaci TaxID=112090 RepID=A0A418BSH4_APHAT|nr:hypothetical protein DYB34_004871 [Aphanomyces astaci]